MMLYRFERRTCRGDPCGRPVSGRGQAPPLQRRHPVLHGINYNNEQKKLGLCFDSAQPFAYFALKKEIEV